MRVRSGFSFRYAFGKLPDVFARVVELGWGAAPISDRESTFAFRKWADLCAKAGIKPVFGCELGVSPNAGAKKTIRDWWTFFAIDDLRPLHDLIAMATRRSPACLTYKEAVEARGVIKITGNALLWGALEPVVYPMTQWPENLYFGLSPSVPRDLYRRVAAAGMPMIATSDNRYLRPEDKEVYRVALGTLGKRGPRADNQTWPMHLLDDQEWAESVGDGGVGASVTDIAGALANRASALAKCNVTLRRATLPNTDWIVDDNDY